MGTGHRLVLNGPPAQVTRFFGRDRELKELADHVGEARLVTLVGAPGSGKTRLTIELLGRLPAVQEDGGPGRCFVDLAPVGEPGSVTSAVARALGLPVRGDRLVAEAAVHEALAGRDDLVVVDNCEHLVAAVASFVAGLLAACPAVRVVATSRVRLGIVGELVWPVAPLALDPAVELFVDRGRLAEPAFAPSGDQLGELARICERLDCLPLAVELVAAWLRVLAPAEILGRLDEAWHVLAADGRELGQRHPTMAAAIEQSWRLLEPEDRHLFEALSVFSGPFDLDGFQAIAGTEHGQLVRLRRLVDQSLVAAEGAPDGTRRYRLLDLVRQFGRRRLMGRAEHEAVRARHAEHCLRIAKGAETDFGGPGQQAALRRLAHHEADLAAAVAWACEHRPGVALRIHAALAETWLSRAWSAAALQAVDAALVAGADDDRSRAAMLSAAARVLTRHGDLERAAQLVRESLAIVEALGDAVAVAKRWRALGAVALAGSRNAEAVGHFERSVTILRTTGDGHGLAWHLMSVGVAHHAAGDHAAGDTALQEAIELHRQAGNDLAVALGLLGLTQGTWFSGDVASHRTRLTEALDLLHRGDNLDDPHWLASGCLLAVAENRIHSAVRLAGATLVAVEQRGAIMTGAVELPPDYVRERCRAFVGEAAAERLLAEGAALPLHRLVQEALALPSDFPAVGPLSRRESEVARLVGEGLANPEIAAKLYISPRTVETHVRHVKEKLGLVTRTEVADWARRSTATTP